MDHILQTLLEGVAAALAPVIAAYVIGLLRKLLAKADLELSAQQQAKVEYWVNQGILEAEEWAAARVKAGIATNGSDKLRKAVSAALPHLPDHNGEQVSHLVQSLLPRLGLGASGQKS